MEMEISFVIIVALLIVGFLAELLLICYEKCLVRRNAELTRLLKESSDLNSSLLDMNRKNLDCLHEFQNQIVLLMTTKLMLALFIALENGNHEQKSYFINRLIFLGVPRRHLADFQSMQKFFMDCESGRYCTREIAGRSAYQFEFFPKN